MKILYIHQYFKTPKQPGGTRSYWISQELLKNGHEVSMITSNKNIDGEFEKVEIDGIEVVYLDVIYDSGSMSILSRFMAFMKFVLKSIPMTFKEKNVDLVIATSTPLTVGIPALLLKWFKGIPYIFEVRDLWPEVPIQMGGLRNPLIKAMAKTLEKTIYRNASHIVALSPGMAEGVINRNINEEKVSMIPNMSKIDNFWVRDENEELIRELGLKPDSFKVIYFGAMGIANGMNYIIDGISLLKEHEDIEFLFLGGGGTKEEIQARCEQEGLKNAKFLGSFPMEILSEIVNFCDVSLVTFKNLPILATNSPNKLFDSLSAGKPIIVNSPGWTKELVENHRCGIYANPEVPEELANAILKLYQNREMTLELGVNSRRLAEEVYDKSILCAQFAQVVDKTIEGF